MAEHIPVDGADSSDEGIEAPTSLREYVRTTAINTLPPLIAYYALRAFGVTPYLALAGAIITAVVQGILNMVIKRKFELVNGVVIVAAACSLTVAFTTKNPRIVQVTELIPVAPACHYASGGVRTDLWGRSTVPGLYATGEAACSGVHGANRLASNSLLEGLVFSRRIAQVLPGELRPLQPPVADARTAGLVAGGVRRELQDAMTTRVGVLRSAAGLADAVGLLDKLSGETAEVIDQQSWETTNLLTIAIALADAAALREETRGSHWREDFPERDDEGFAGHFDVVMADGASTLEFVPAAPTDRGAA